MDRRSASSWCIGNQNEAEAIAHPQTDPIVPGAMDAYAGSPLPKRLGIGEGSVVALLGAPEGFEQALADVPASVRLVRDLTEAPSVLLPFARSQAGLKCGFPGADAALADGGKLWICWPKRASAVDSDLTQSVVRLRSGVYFGRLQDQLDRFDVVGSLFRPAVALTAAEHDSVPKPESRWIAREGLRTFSGIRVPRRKNDPNGPARG